MIKIAIVDDQPLIISGLSMMINFQEDMNVIWTAENGKEALLKLEIEKPDLILLDIRMPEMNGVETTKAIRKKYEDVKILILTTFNDDEYIFETLKYGSSGYLLKDVPPNELMYSIRKAIGGGVIIEPQIASKVVKNIKIVEDKIKLQVIEKLTPREFDISKYIAEGLSNKEICEKLFLSEGTIKNHITSILDKLELRDRTQLAIFILKNEI